MQGHSDRFHTCREVLQRGLFLNRKSAALVQVRLLPGTLKGTNLAMMLSTNHQGVSDATHPDMVSLTQAWGLMELQKGNILAAVLLLVRAPLC